MTSPTSLPDDPGALPTENVAAFVAALAQAHGVAYVRTFADDWCDAVTRLSDDTVSSDATTNLLVALSRAQLLTSEQMTVLLMNHLRERRAFHVN